MASFRGPERRIVVIGGSAGGIERSTIPDGERGTAGAALGVAKAPLLREDARFAGTNPA